jgi:3-oxoacyl-[acyl-carrier-protein] synthase-3
LLRKRGISPDELDVIICATVTGDMIFPSSACVIADKIGAKNAWGFDLQAACSGFLFGLETGAKFIESGKYKKVLLYYKTNIAYKNLIVLLYEVKKYIDL